MINIIAQKEIIELRDRPLRHCGHMWSHEEETGKDAVCGGAGCPAPDPRNGGGIWNRLQGGQRSKGEGSVVDPARTSRHRPPNRGDERWRTQGYDRALSPD